VSAINWLFEKSESLLIRGCKALGNRLPKFTIENEGAPYLSRFYLIRKGRSDDDFDEEGVAGFREKKLNKYLSVYLHYFHRGDEDASLHNHPWRRSYSLILTNGYREERWDSKTKTVITRTLRPGSINRIMADDFHRVELLDPTRGAWTLFFTGSRVKEPWGFWWPGVHDFIPHYNFTRSRTAHDRPS
jgi:hypothetical protein